MSILRGTAGNVGGTTILTETSSGESTGTSDSGCGGTVMVIAWLPRKRGPTRPETDRRSLVGNGRTTSRWLPKASMVSLAAAMMGVAPDTRSGTASRSPEAAVTAPTQTTTSSLTATVYAVGSTRTTDDDWATGDAAPLQASFAGSR